jgi:hypothetical protein
MIRRSSMSLALAAFGLLVCAVQPSWAQDNPAGAQPASSAASQGTQSPASSNEKPKKVWTNDDLKAAGKVSVVGDPRNQKYTMTKPPDPATVAKYKANLQKLQEQLNDVNKKLQGFQEFESGKVSSENGQDVSHGYSRTPVNQQIVKLQDKKKQLETQIDDLYESARKIGIESGDLK